MSGLMVGAMTDAFLTCRGTLPALSAILPIELPCKMDAFGIIRQRDHLLSPGADVLLRAVRVAAAEIY